MTGFARVIAAAIAQIAYLNRSSTALDPTFESWPAVLCAQIVQNLGIITACIPYLKPFLESLESGLIRSDDLRQRTEGSHGEHSAKSSRAKGRQRSSSLERLALKTLGGEVTTTAVRNNGEVEKGTMSPMTIRETKTWGIRTGLT